MDINEAKKRLGICAASEQATQACGGCIPHAQPHIAISNECASIEVSLKMPEDADTPVLRDMTAALQSGKSVRFSPEKMAGNSEHDSRPQVREVEDKAGFVAAFQDALIKYGAGCYDWLKDNPIRYEKTGVREVIELADGEAGANVTGCSLTSIADCMIEII